MELNDKAEKSLPTVASLWLGGSLGWLERLCLASFLAAGHRVILFTYEEVSGIPEGVVVSDAHAIWSPEPKLLEATAPSYLADIFRVYLMEKTDAIWVDTDVLCLAPLVPSEDGYLLGWTPWYGEINNAIMRIPRGSKLLEEIKTTLEDMSVIPAWLRPAARKKLSDLPMDERLVGRFHLKRTVLGPACLTYLAKRHVAKDSVLEPDVLFPVPWQFSDALFNPVSGTEAWVTSRTCTVHLWSHVIRRHKKRKPYASSFVGQWAEKLKMLNETDIPQYPAARADQNFE